MTERRARLLPARIAIVAILAVGTLLAVAPATPAAEDALAQRAVAVRGDTWHVRTNLDGGAAHDSFNYGRADDLPLIGDWNGNGRPTPGVVRGRMFYLNNDLGGGAADRAFAYGLSSDVPIVGDWNGDGVQTVGVRRGRTFYLRNDNSAGDAHHTFVFGLAGDVPIVGDWDGDGTETVGVVRGNTFHLRNDHRGGAADHSFAFGWAGDVPVTGDWDGDGIDTVGVIRGNTFHLRNDHRGGAADHSFSYGTGDDTLLAWSGLPSAGTVWDELAQCEANGDWTAVNPAGPYYGGLQFHPDTWAAYGGHEFAANAHQASREQQIVVGVRLHASRGWAPWPSCSSSLGL